MKLSILTLFLTLTKCEVSRRLPNEQEIIVSELTLESGLLPEGGFYGMEDIPSHLPPRTSESWLTGSNLAYQF